MSKKRIACIVALLMLAAAMAVAGYSFRHCVTGLPRAQSGPGVTPVGDALHALKAAGDTVIVVDDPAAVSVLMGPYSRLDDAEAKAAGLAACQVRLVNDECVIERNLLFRIEDGRVVVVEVVPYHLQLPGGWLVRNGDTLVATGPSDSSKTIIVSVRHAAP